MMTLLKRILGIIVIIFSAASLLASGFVIVELWTLRAPLTAAVGANLDQLSATLDTTRSALSVVNDSLQDASETIDKVQDSLLTASTTVSSTTTALDGASGLLGQDLPTSLAAAQTALRSAQASAKVVDDVLATLSRLPLLNVNYTPAVSLNAGLGQVADTLSPLSVSLSNFQKQFAATSASLSPLAGNFSVMAQSMTRLRRDVASARTVVGQYQNQVTQYQNTVVALKGAFAVSLSAVALALTFVLGWLVILQLQWLFMGLRWLSARRSRA